MKSWQSEKVGLAITPQTNKKVLQNQIFSEIKYKIFGHEK